MNETNTAQIEYWNATAGPKWVRLQSLLDRQIRPFGLAAMDVADPTAEERVVDVGCGCGDTTVELARRVGTTGHVIGLDVSRTMLARAAEGIRSAGLPHVDLVCADAQAHPLPAHSFDLIYSRFGVMFFTDPPAAFANLRRALGPQGRLAFVCWQEAAVNPWMREPTLAIMQYVEVDIPRDPHAPGPFALADRDRLRQILIDAGYSNVSIEPFSTFLALGGGMPLEEAVTFMLDMNPAGAKLAELTPERRQAASKAVRRVLESYETPNGVSMPGAAWLVSAAGG